MPPITAEAEALLVSRAEHALAVFHDEANWPFSTVCAETAHRLAEALEDLLYLRWQPDDRARAARARVDGARLLATGDRAGPAEGGSL